MADQLIVSGHGLIAEGAAFDLDPLGSPYRNFWNSTSGRGRALCACGAYSDVLESGAARKRWHKNHKQQIADAIVHKGN